MVIHKMVGEECNKTRSLWEEVFWEDSIQFTDYYFKHKAKLNTGYVIGEYPYNAMLFRTPYMLQIGEVQKEISYIVGVATRREYRKKGYMRSLLECAFREMYDEKQPFTFLMPANPAIYEPFDFRYVYERDQWKVKNNRSELSAAEMVCKKSLDANDLLDGIYTVSQIREELPEFPIFEMLAAYANTILKENYTVYAHRDVAYYKRQLEESKAQNGDIYVLFRQNEIQGFYLYAKEEDEVYIQELLKERHEDFAYIEKTGQKPIIMARIVHLEEMLKLVKSPKEMEVVIQVKDPWIRENEGVYGWKIGPWGSQIQPLEEAEKIDYQFHIVELTTHLLKGVFLNEIV